MILSHQSPLRTKHLRRKLWFELHTNLWKRPGSARTYLQLTNQCMFTHRVRIQIFHFPPWGERNVTPKAFHETDRPTAVWLTSSERTRHWSHGHLSASGGYFYAHSRLWIPTWFTFYQPTNHRFMSLNRVRTTYNDMAQHTQERATEVWFWGRYPLCSFDFRPLELALLIICIPIKPGWVWKLFWGLGGEKKPYFKKINGKWLRKNSPKKAVFLH